MEVRDQNRKLPVIFIRLKNPYIFIGCARDSRFSKNPLLSVAQLLYVLAEENENGI
jgi:hypothetical protein